MPFQLPSLPYSKDALAPFLTSETLDYHYGKHHQAYVNKLNDLVKGTEWEAATLEDIMKKTDGGVFNNAAQIWNHTFYWNTLSTKENMGIPSKLEDMIKKDFGSLEKLEEEFKTAGATQFGSGWAWLVQAADGKLAVRKTPNAENPITKGENPLLTCDVWEHAYYIDFRNARPKYIDAFYNRINWEFAASNLK